MKKLRNHLIGVDQGTENLFSDFENGGAMWTGSGTRTRNTHIKFSETFRTIPMVHISLDMWDMDHNSNSRAEVSAKNIKKDGFDIVFTTWGDTKIARVRASWLAMGEVKNDEEWELY